MSQFKRDLDHATNKFAGGVKEAAGKVSGNEQLELKGKMQSSKADLKKDTSVANKVEEVKEKIAGSINDKIDQKRKEDKKRK